MKPPVERAAVVAIAAALAACSGAEEAPAPPVEDKCPAVDPDHMAGRWVKVVGSKAVPRSRFEVVEKGAGPGGHPAYEMWHVEGFTRRVLEGRWRTQDFVFDERLPAEKQVLYDQGGASRLRLYVEPRKQSCALRVVEVRVSKDGDREVEKPVPGFQEYAVFPEGTVMTFRPCTGELFLGRAAKSRKAALAQVAETGGADPAHQLDEKLPVGTWSKVAEDGPADCTYDMDLYFDDVPVKDRQHVPAGEVEGGFRHWYVADWYAPFSGNHHFQAYRYRTCPGQERELLGVDCLEAALHP